MREWIGRTVVAVAAVVLTLGALEIGLRAARGTLGQWGNLVLEARQVLANRESSRFVDDELLGYRPRSGYAAPGVAFDSAGLRATGEGGTTPPILATGDSYTYGDEVGDRETWPAHLQQLTGRRVLNGGVSGYGFDQSVLRAEQLAAVHKPAAIVVSFIPDDIRRTEMRRQWGAEKPYFVPAGDGLALRNVPVPPRPDPRSTLTFWQRLLGQSVLFDFVLRRLDLLYDWFGDHVRAQAPGTGEKIACLLTDRLRELQVSAGVPVMVLAEYDPMVWQKPEFAAEQRRLAQGLLACARKRGLVAIDSYDALAAAPGGPAGLYGLWHMNDKGNRLIAGLVSDALARASAR